MREEQSLLTPEIPNTSVTMHAFQDTKFYCAHLWDPLRQVEMIKSTGSPL